MISDTFLLWTSFGDSLGQFQVSSLSGVLIQRYCSSVHISVAGIVGTVLFHLREVSYITV